jgi:hypothetical protein
MKLPQRNTTFLVLGSQQHTIEFKTSAEGTQNTAHLGAA